MVKYLHEISFKIDSSIVLRILLVWGLATYTLLLAIPANSQETNHARILVRAAEKIDIRTQIIAPVLKIPYQAGERFASGALLIQFDCAQYEAEKKAAGAAALASGIEYQTKRKLLKHRAAGKDEVKLAAAISAKANAELDIHQLRTDQCLYNAPFDGRVVSRNVDEFEYPPADKPLLTILNDSHLELQLVIPSRWMRWIHSGFKFTFDIDETGKSYSGVVDRLGAEVDPVSQTIIITGKFEGKHSKILAGMSGTAHFDIGS